MGEVVYTAESQLRSPARFAADTWADLRVSPPLAWRLFLHRLRANYRQSRLGYFWLLAPPLATTATWVFLNAARVLNVGPTETPYAVYVLTGTLLWQVFADALNAPLQQLTSARAILTRSRVPHEALLLAGLYEVLFNFLVRLLVLLPVLVWYGPELSFSPASLLLLAPFGVAALLLLGLAAGLLLTPVGLLYQDVPRGLAFAVGFWFFLTPVVYPPPTGGRAALLSKLNPVVSTNLPEVSNFNGKHGVIITSPNRAKEFVASIERALIPTGEESVITRRREVAALNDWEARYERMSRLIEQELRRKRGE